MMKVKIVFNCRLKLWDFKQVIQKRVVHMLLWKRSLICLCSESEIEIARHAYNAKIEEIK